MMRDRRMMGEGGSNTAMYAGGLVVGSIVLLALLRVGFRGHLG